MKESNVKIRQGKIFIHTVCNTLMKNGSAFRNIGQNNNLLLTEREGRTGDYWPEVVAKTTEGQNSLVRLEQARLVSSLLYGTLSLL